MKISIIATLLILATGVGMNWHMQQKLATAQNRQKQLAAEMAKLEPAQISRSTKRRVPPAATAKLTIAELIGLAKGARQLELFDSLSTLNPAELTHLLTEISTHQDLDDQIEISLQYFISTTLAIDHPQAALELFTSSPELFAKWDKGMSIVCTALASWARNDPTSALDWLRKHPQQFSDIASTGIISAVAQQDPQLAFRLISDPDFKNSDQKVWNIIDSTKSLEEKSAALAGMREHLITIQDEKIRARVVETAIREIARSISRESFDSTTRWIAGENFSQSELTQLSENFDVSHRTNETGKWIGWFRKSLPTNITDSRVSSLIDHWALTDYQAAVKWAATQPSGKDRDQVYQTIQANWPKEDPAGKANFAKQHGIR